MEKESCKSAQTIQTKPWNCCCTQNENLRMEKGSCKSAQMIQTEPWNYCCTQNENLRTEKGSCKSAQMIQTEKINTNLLEGQKTRAKNFSCRPGAPFSALRFLRFTFPGSAPRCLYNSRSPTRSLFHPVRDPR